MESISADDARRSLDSIGASRREVADRMITPRWYYPALGLLVAQMIVMYGLVGDLLAVLSALLVVAGSGWMVRTYTGHTGIVARLPDGLRSGVALAAFALGMIVPVMYVVLVGDVPTAVVLALAALALVCTVVLGPVYDAAYRADLRRKAVEGAA